MKATKETLSPTRVKLTVEVPFDDLKPSLDATYKKLSRQIRVSGFRPGKVPPRILDQRLGREVILDEALQEALPSFYSQAVEAEDVDVLSRPEVDVTEFTEGSPIVFTAEVDIRPDVTLPETDSLKVTVDAVEVTDEQVDTQLDSMRERFAVLTPVERPVASGDYVSLDLSAVVDGEPVEDATATGMSYEVGSGNLIDGIDDAIIGAAEGDSRTFDTELLAGDKQGQTAQVTATVRGVKEKELPALDDDFATTASEFDTLDELKADVRERLEGTRKFEQVNQARERLLEQLIETVDVPVPDSVLATEIEAREHRLGHDLERFGVDRETYLKTLDQEPEEFDSQVRDSATKAIKSQFILDTVVRTESIGIDQGELMEQIMLLSQRMGVAPEQYAQQLASGNGSGLTALMSDIMRNKALLHLLRAATVVDGEDNPVTLELPEQPEPLDIDDHEGHDHEGHDHEGHDHEGHDHEGHDHDHDHDDHEGHNH
ncbi:trigger factor [Pseudofrankia asymbiotica]|uniref:Trigger factor n=1 Tax=Pseudofrankia asymbiotica TaxID=1834516 RepID=A0A1V2I3E1_9ACTN|nr:trigger factor [Pseudofrankia asymbiotica]ONH24341.1 trigger factor [Pseudofrankia asymbiotica]